MRDVGIWEEWESGMQEDFSWGIGVLDDPCAKVERGTSPRIDGLGLVRQAVVEEVGPCEREELARFKKMGVYEYEDRREAEMDSAGKHVKVKLVRINTGMDEHPVA